MEAYTEDIRDVAIRVFEHLGANQRAWADICSVLDAFHVQEARRKLEDRRNGDPFDIGYRRGELEVFKTMCNLQQRCKTYIERKQ